MAIFAAAGFVVQLIFPGSRPTDSGKRPVVYDILIVVIAVATVAAAIWGLGLLGVFD